MVFKPAAKSAVATPREDAKVNTTIRSSEASLRQTSQAKITELHERRVKLEKEAHEKRAELNRILKESKRQPDGKVERELRRIIDRIEKDIRKILKQITQEQDKLIKLAFYRIDELAERTEKLVSISNGLKSMVYMDTLTELGNRRAITAELEKEVKKALRSGSAKLAVLFMDMDGLKWANDNFGHDFGDSMLKRVGDALKADEVLRVGDFAGRLGGDEFVVIMPNTSHAGAQAAARRISDALNPEGLSPQEVRKEKQLKNISVSFGVAALDDAEFAKDISEVSNLHSKIKEAKARDSLEKKGLEIGKALVEIADVRMQESRKVRKAERE